MKVRSIFSGLMFLGGVVFAVDFQPVDDAYVSKANPTTNYGSDTLLRIRSGNSQETPYLKFEVSGLVETVASVRLVVYGVDTAGAATIYSVADNTWAEGSITWSNRPPAGTAVDTVTLATADYSEFDLSSVVTGNGTYSFCIEDYALTVSDRIRSTEYGGAFIPTLAVETKADWQIVDTGYPTDDMVVAPVVMNAARLPADPANEDCSAAFNAAFQEVSGLGGGFVYAPAGEYLFTNVLDVTPNVVLRGAWGSVAGDDKSVRGTVLKVAYNGMDSTNGADRAFIELDDRAGLRDLTIWYPNQSLTNVIPYVTTIDCVGSGSDEVNVENINLVNAYIGFSPVGNMIRAYGRNVYGSPLKLGMYQNRSSDVPTYTGVYFSADYWAESGLPGAPSKTDLQNYLRANATGIKVGASDNIFAAEWHVADYNKGFHFLNEGLGTINGNLYGLHAANCSTGLLVDAIGPTFIINSGFEGDEAAVFKSLSNQGVLFNGCSFESVGDYAFKYTQNNGLERQLVFQHCTFNKRLQAGSTQLTVIDSTFDYTAGSPLKLASGSDYAILAGNTFVYSGDPVELNGADPDIVVLDSSPTGSRTYSPFDIDGYEKHRQPAASNLVVMGSAGYAVNVDGTTDDAPAIQQALDDVSALGGGIVLVPQISESGYAIRTALNVPAGVELRSSAESTHSFNGKRESVPAALLQVYHGEGGSEATITLNEGSGLKGFTIHYPELTTETIRPYAVTVKAIGDGAYVQNNHFVNTYSHVEFNGSDNHLLENNLAQHIYRPFTVINCSHGRFNHNNVRGEWGGSALPSFVDSGGMPGFSMSNCIPYTVIDSHDQQIFGSFSRMSKWLGSFSNSSLQTLDFSMESCHNACIVNGIPGGEKIELIGSSLRTNNDTSDTVTMFDVTTAPGDGTFEMFSALCTGYPDTILRATDADTLFQNSLFGLSTRKVGTHGITLAGSSAGVSRFEGCLLNDSFVSTDIAQVDGKRLELVGNMFEDGLEYASYQTQMKNSVDSAELKDSTRIANVANLATPALATSLNFDEPGESGMKALTGVYDMETRDAFFRQWFETVTGQVPMNTASNLRFEVTDELFDAGDEPATATIRFFYYDWEAGEINVKYRLAGAGWVTVDTITLTGDGGYELPHVKGATNPYFHLAEYSVPGEMFKKDARIMLEVPTGKAIFSYVLLKSGDGMARPPYGTVLTAYETWVAGFGLSGGDASGDFDYDGDSLDNFSEYALGGDPTNAAVQGVLPEMTVGSNWIEYVYPRRTAPDSGLVYQLELTDDLVAGSWTNADFAELTQTGVVDEHLEAVTNRVDMAGKIQQFIRLKIEQE